MYACNFGLIGIFCSTYYQDTSIYTCKLKIITRANYLLSSFTTTTTVFRENMWIYEYEMNAWLHHHRHHHISSISIINFNSRGSANDTLHCTHTNMTILLKYLCDISNGICIACKVFFAYKKNNESQKIKKTSAFSISFQSEAQQSDCQKDGDLSCPSVNFLQS